MPLLTYCISNPVSFLFPFIKDPDLLPNTYWVFQDIFKKMFYLSEREERETECLHRQGRTAGRKRRRLPTDQGAWYRVRSQLWDHGLNWRQMLNWLEPHPGALGLLIILKIRVSKKKLKKKKKSGFWKTHKYRKCTLDVHCKYIYLRNQLQVIFVIGSHSLISYDY